MTLPFWEARLAVLSELGPPARPALEEVPLAEALGRVLGEALAADRDQPPFDRVTRDGFAVRAADVAGVAEGRPRRLAVIGEAPPGARFPGSVGPGQCVEIMTGAPLPDGADAVVMVEYTARIEPGLVELRREATAGENVVPCGSELRAGAAALAAGHRLDPAAIGLLASLGCARPRVFARPRVAIVSTGDELVEVEQMPQPTQIRDSNRRSIAAQVLRAGGVPRPAPIARDRPEEIREALQAALEGADLLLLSGGVSAGKYDYVEGALAALGARMVFDAVAIRPGKPLVFGRVGERPFSVPFFGLPGNPLSTLVTFELFVRPALELLAGAAATPLRFALVPLAAEHVQRSLPLTAFLPALLEGEGPSTRVRPLPSAGSGDLGAMARADCLVLIEPGSVSLPAGTPVPVLPK